MQARPVDRQSQQRGVDGLVTNKRGGLAGETCTSVSWTRGSRSFQTRTHLVGVTPGTYPSLNSGLDPGGTSGPVTSPDYRA